MAAQVETSLSQALSTPTIESPESGLQVGTKKVPWTLVIAVGYAVIKLGLFKKQLRMLSVAGRR